MEGRYCDYMNTGSRALQGVNLMGPKNSLCFGFHIEQNGDIHRPYVTGRLTAADEPTNVGVLRTAPDI